MKPIVLAELKIPSALSELARIRKFLRDLLGDRYLALGDKGIYQLELAASEAASNIITHAYGDSPAQEVLMEVEVFAGHICIRLRHTGKAFEPEMMKPPLFDGMQTSGFGLYIIAQCVDRVDYFRNGHGKNTICMTKSYHRAPSPRSKRGSSSGRRYLQCR
jgi:anti-sigma regulatory factor (Ser/Thr protein kinase)